MAVTSVATSGGKSGGSRAGLGAFGGAVEPIKQEVDRLDLPNRTAADYTLKAGQARVKIRFGIVAGRHRPLDQLAGIVDHSETSRVDSLWFSELVYSPAVDPMVGMVAGPDDPTEASVVLPGRHPVLVAEQLAFSPALPSRRSRSSPLGLRSAIPAEREVFVVPTVKRGRVDGRSGAALGVA